MSGALAVHVSDHAPLKYVVFKALPSCHMHSVHEFQHGSSYELGRSRRGLRYMVGCVCIPAVTARFVMQVQLNSFNSI